MTNDVKKLKNLENFVNDVWLGCFYFYFSLCIIAFKKLQNGVLAVQFSRMMTILWQTVNKTKLV
jgi:hypothetical protein